MGSEVQHCLNTVSVSVKFVNCDGKLSKFQQFVIMDLKVMASRPSDFLCTSWVLPLRKCTMILVLSGCIHIIEILFTSTIRQS